MSQIANAALITKARLTEQDDDFVVLSVPHTDYRIKLVLDGELPTDVELNDPISGIIKAHAQRADIMQAGGRFVEPVFGRPRRIQGRIIGGNVETNTIVVDCGVKIHATLLPHQNAGAFKLGQIVGFDIRSGATFTPA